MAAENAIETLNSLKAQWQADKNRPVWKPLASCNLYSIFLVRSPHRMLSISNTQGTSAVAVGGIRTRHTQKQYYRHFNIRQVSGPDDFASMEEVLTRVSIAG
jgi:excinuclease ABC subunit C